jgi:hypothetical protein
MSAIVAVARALPPLLRMLGLLLTGRISRATVAKAVRERPVCVAGRGGSWVVDAEEYRRLHE